MSARSFFGHRVRESKPCHIIDALSGGVNPTLVGDLGRLGYAGYQRPQDAEWMAAPPMYYG